MSYELIACEELFLALREDEPPIEPHNLASRRRRRVVARLEELSFECATRRRLSQRWRTWGAFALAATVVLSIGVGWFMRDRVATRPAGEAAAASVLSVTGTVNLLRDGQLRTLAGTQRTAVGRYELVETTRRSGARLLSRRGTVVQLGPLTRMRFVVGPKQPPGAERIEVTVGRVEVDVPEGAARESFSVRTPTALLLVHGTRFTVEVSSATDAKPGATSVHVTLGLVLVRHQRDAIRVEAGDSWSSASADSPPGALAAKDTARDVPAVVRRPEQRRSEVSPVQSARPRSIRASNSLAEVNRLYAAAMAAKRAGTDQLAVQHLEELLRRFPDCSLAANARVERFRALARLGKRQEAARSARAYLSEHPRGFASAEALELVSGAGRSSPRPAQ